MSYARRKTKFQTVYDDIPPQMKVLNTNIPKFVYDEIMFPIPGFKICYEYS